jgi:hypothetical protein
MASPHLYVRSTDGSDSDNGTTWALAKATVAGAAAIDSTTDNRIWVSDNHAESGAANANQAWALAGTAADPTWVVCVDDASNPEPPTALATTATCTTTGTGSFAINGFAYIYGITWNVGTGAVNVNINFDSVGSTPKITVEQCAINLVATGSNCRVIIGGTFNVNPAQITFNEVAVKFANVASGIRIPMSEFFWNGGSVAAGSTACTTGLIQPDSLGEYSRSLISAVDLTNVGVTGFLVQKTNNAACDVQFVNCKIPAFTTGGLVNGTLQPGDRIRLYNCDSADTNYRLWIEDFFGIITSDTSVYNDAGADDGSGQGFSWKMVSTANTEFPHQYLPSSEIVKWNETTSGTLTATVEIVHDSQGSGTNGALRDNEIWLEVMCMDPGGTPIGKWQSDRCVNLNLNSNVADQASSSASWTGDSAGWDTQKLSVSFTPKEKGYVHARVCLAKASTTVYVDPLLTIA